MTKTTKKIIKKSTTKKKIDEVVAEVQGVDVVETVAVADMQPESIKPAKPSKPKSEPIAEVVKPIKMKEITTNIASGTPSKDFANSVIHFFEDYQNCVITIRAIGAGATHTATKAIIEANRYYIAKGKMIARFDFWTNDQDKSVNNIRILLVDVHPTSLASALVGRDVEYIPVGKFVNREEGETNA